MEVFGKGACAASAAMNYSLRIWNLISSGARFIIQDTHPKEHPHINFMWMRGTGLHIFLQVQRYF